MYKSRIADMHSPLCKCGQPCRTGGRYCLACHAAATRRYRQRTPLTADQRARNNALRYARVYVERGKIQRQPCVSCGSVQVQVHLQDWRKPKQITWLCKQCRPRNCSTQNNPANTESDHGA